MANVQVGKPTAAGFSTNPVKVACSNCKTNNWIVANGVAWKCFACGTKHG